MSQSTDLLARLITEHATSGRFLEMELTKQLLAAEPGCAAGIANQGEPWVTLVRERRAGPMLRCWLTLCIVSLHLVAWVRLLLATGRHQPGSARFAVHDEQSNRTRHLLGIHGELAPDEPVMLLGTPHGVLSQAGRAVVLPLDVATVLANCGCLAAAYLAWQYAGLVDLRQLAAMIYRRQLGLAQSCWWAASDADEPWVVFGHTGTADTSYLERAIQAGGGQTVHVFHGLTPGAVFTGISSVLVPLCKADGDVHMAFGGYGRVHCETVPAPNWRGPWQGEELVLMTNLAHPTNPAYLRDGVTAECTVLAEVAAAGPGLGRDWKPHPVLARLPERERTLVESTAHEAGYGRLPGDFSAASRPGALYVTTLSTVILDLLKLGILPVVYRPAMAQDGAVPAGVPEAASVAALAAIINAAPHLSAADYHAAFAAVGPALPQADMVRSLLGDTA